MKKANNTKQKLDISILYEIHSINDRVLCTLVLLRDCEGLEHNTIEQQVIQGAISQLFQQQEMIKEMAGKK